MHGMVIAIMRIVVMVSQMYVMYVMVQQLMMNVATHIIVVNGTRSLQLEIYKNVLIMHKNLEQNTTELTGMLKITVLYQVVIVQSKTGAQHVNGKIIVMEMKNVRGINTSYVIKMIYLTLPIQENVKIMQM